MAKMIRLKLPNGQAGEEQAVVVVVVMAVRTQ
jgi:hypothetical protein